MAKKEIDLSKLLKEMDKEIVKLKPEKTLAKEIKAAEKQGKKIAKENAKEQDK